MGLDLSTLENNLTINSLGQLKTTTKPSEKVYAVDPKGLQQMEEIKAIKKEEAATTNTQLTNPRYILKHAISSNEAICSAKNDSPIPAVSNVL